MDAVDITPERLAAEVAPLLGSALIGFDVDGVLAEHGPAQFERRQGGGALGMPRGSVGPGQGPRSPYLAESWELAPDSTSITLRLVLRPQGPSENLFSSLPQTT